MNKKILYLLSFLLIIIVPVVVNFLMMFSTPLTKGAISDWISFYGSYIGSLLGFFGVILTIRYSKKEAMLDREESAKKFKEEQKLLYRPYFKANLIGGVKSDDGLFSLVATDKSLLKIGIKNCGNSFAPVLKINKIDKNNNYHFLNGFNDYVVQAEPFELPIILLDKSQNKGVITLELAYKDIFNNGYSQTIIIHYEMVKDTIAIFPITTTAPIEIIF